MKEYSKNIHSYGEFITGHLIHLLDYINDNTNLKEEEYNNVTKEIELIGHSINNIYFLLEQYNYKPQNILLKTSTSAASEITKDRKIHLIRDIKINTIITDNE